MARQNRVDPFGRIVADAARGLLMGNRGCLHDEHGRIVRTSARPAWITCLPTWPGVRRPLMQPGHYTELFFLDEVTGLAAGHRPCGSCRPDALVAFKSAWQRAFDLPYRPCVASIDEVLRADSRDGASSIDDLPDGLMVAIAERPFLTWRGQLLPWSANGYQPSVGAAAGPVRALTSSALVGVLRAGYRPWVHPSADQAIDDYAARDRRERERGDLIKRPLAVRSSSTQR